MEPPATLGVVVTYERLGELIRERREARPMTQAELGEAVGAIVGRHVSARMVSHWETGRRIPVDWRTVAAIGAVLGVAFVMGAGAPTIAGLAVGSAIGAVALEAKRESEAADAAARAGGEDAEGSTSERRMP